MCLGLNAISQLRRVITPSLEASELRGKLRMVLEVFQVVELPQKLVQDVTFLILQGSF